MIDAREIQRTLRLPDPDEVEVQRIGGEIVAILRSPAFDGTPIQYEITVGETQEQFQRSSRIACAIQRRFQSKLWTVFLEPFVDSANPETLTKVHRLSITLDAVAIASQSTPRNGTGVVKQLVLTDEPVTDVQTLPILPCLSIILGTHNRLVLLKRAVESVRRAVGALAYEIVVCDGGSTDGSRAWLAAQPDVLLIGERRMEGAVRAFNQAYALSRGEFIANFNDDARYESDALIRAVEHLRAHATCGQVALPFFDKSQGKRTVNAVFPRDMFPEVTWGTTYANFGVIKRSVIEKMPDHLHFWNPIYRTYAGDCELSARVWKLGYTVDTLDGPGVEDELVSDDLREKNSPDLAIDTHKMNEQWPAAAFKPAQGIVCAEATSIFPEPQEEERLRKLAPRLRALDPVDGCLPQRAEELSPERILHVHINGMTNPDQQDGLVNALGAWSELARTHPNISEYKMVRWPDLDAEIRQAEIIAAAEAVKPTLIFMQLQAPDAVSPKTLRALRTIVPGVVIVTWNGDIASCNSPWNVEWQVPFARLCDLTLHSSMAHVRALRAAGIHNAAYLQIGYAPVQYRPPLRAPAERDADGRPMPIADSDGRPLINPDDVTAYTFGDWRARYRSYDVAFLGSNYDGSDEFSKSTRWNDGPLRAEVVAKMKEAFGWKFCCYGSGWAKPGKRDMLIPVGRSHEVYQRAKVGLSVSLMNDLECYSSDRLHRILGCGALALVKRFPGMSTWGLEDGVNCRIWDTADEAVTIAKDCLGPEADSIRKAGAELARDHLTWDVRMRELQLYVDAVRAAR